MEDHTYTLTSLAEMFNLDPLKLKTDWINFRPILSQHLNNETTSDQSTFEFWKKMLLEFEMGQTLRNLIVSLLTLPVSTSEVERSFSIMNMIKTSGRSKLLPSNLDSILRLRMNSKPLNETNFNDHVEKWLMKGHVPAL